MIKHIEPNYVHYTRVKVIPAYEAQWLLAILELRGREFSEQNEYDRALKLEMTAACKVLWKAFDSNDIKYDFDDIPYDIDAFGRKGFYFCNIRINVADFFSWASDLKYNLPPILAELSVTPSNSAMTPAQEANESSPPESSPPEKIEPKNKGGKPKGQLAEAVEHAYKKLLKQGNTAVLKADEMRSYLKQLREMATEGNENADEYILERIKDIKIPKHGVCTITTKERHIRIAARNLNAKRKNSPGSGDGVGKLKISPEGRNLTVTAGMI